MARRDRSGITFDDVWRKLKDFSTTFDFGQNDPQRARQQLISQYNRKPSIYVEDDPVKNCLKLPGRFTDFVKDLFQNNSDLEATAASTETQEQPVRRDNIASGAPRSVFCDSIDVSVYNVLQRTICYAGAGLGIIGVGMVTFFGLFTAAGAACAVTACNKIADQNCQVDVYDPSDSEVYYEGRVIMTAPNNYQPGEIGNNSPMHPHQSYPPYLF
ncbi:major facilitator superfamily transporter [Babesia ovis]|uniref:Major facilitator superfamily transporter n=1 Tax=Babesia ovis TaxID=5869 RepID=A0A9W5TCC3_BABOV|nr:major facilitator superfamily transporter [Babesia ovis]